MKKNVIYLLLIVISASGMFCQRGEQEKNKGPKIALVLKTLNNPFFIDLQNGAVESARQLGFELIVQAPEREVDVEKQMQIMENLIQAQVDVICVTPSGSKEIIPAIAKANKAGIPIIIVDTGVDSSALQESGAFISTFIGSDNFEGGVIAGKYIAEQLNGKGKIAILEGVPGHETGDTRLRGFHYALKEFPGLEVLSSQTANFERDQGYNVFQNMLQSFPQIEALFACNDMMALGAIEAIALAKRTNSLLVVGFDAVEDGKEAIRNGKMNASIAQHPQAMGRLAIENAVKVINGEKIAAKIPVPIDLITKQNVDPVKDTK